MSGSLDQVLEAIARVDHRVEQLHSDFGKLQGDVTHLQGDVTRLQEETLRSRVDLMERLDRQQDVLTAIKDDITVNVAATDSVRDRHKQMRNDYDLLAHQVSLVHRRLMQLEQRFDKEHGL